MRIKAVLEKIMTGKNVKFLEGIITEGPFKDNKVLVVEDKDINKKFVLKASLKNYIRFSKWIGKDAIADYELMWKGVSTNFGKLPLIYISTEVEIDNEGNEYKDNQYDGLGVEKNER